MPLTILLPRSVTLSLTSTSLPPIELPKSFMPDVKPSVTDLKPCESPPPRLSNQLPKESIQLFASLSPLDSDPPLFSGVLSISVSVVGAEKKPCYKFYQYIYLQLYREV